MSNNTTVWTSVLQRIGDSCGFVNAGCLGASSVGGDGYGANDKQEVHVWWEEDKEDSSTWITFSSLICCYTGSIETLRITHYVFCCISFSDCINISIV